MLMSKKPVREQDKRRKPNLKVNFAYNLVYQILAVALPLVTTPYLSRVLGADGLGAYSYTYSIASFFALFILLGIANHGNRAVAASRNDKDLLSGVFINLYVIQLFMGVVVIAAYCVFVCLMPGHNAVLQWIWVAYLVSCALDISWFFFGLELFKITVTRNLVIKLLTFVSIFLFVKTKDDVPAYCLLMAIGMLLSQAMLWPFVKSKIDFVPPTLAGMKEQARPLLVLFIPVLAVGIYTMVNKILLGYISGTEESGFYDNALKIASVPTLAVTALGTVMLPRISYYAGTGQLENVKERLQLSLKIVLGYSFFTFAGFLALADDFCGLFFGPGFEKCGLLMQILGLYVPFFSWANVLRNQYLIPLKRDSAFVLAVITGAIISLVLNAVLVPFLGSVGTAIVTVTSEAVVCVIQTWTVRKDLAWREVLLGCIPFVLFSGLSFVCVKFFCCDAGSSWLSFLAGIALYLCCFAVLTGLYLFIKKARFASDSRRL